MIAEIIKNFDIFLISDSKLYSTFPNTQFTNTGYKYLDMTESDLVEGYFYLWMIKYHPNFWINILSFGAFS